MTCDEHVSSDIKLARKCFENNVAEVHAEGVLTVVDWRIPGSDYHYFVHMVFDPLREMVYVSGDFGSMVIHPTCAITLEGMARTFTRRNDDGTFDLNIGYFDEKIECAQRIHQYDGEDAAREVRERAEEYLQEKADEAGSGGEDEDVEPEFDVDELCDAVESATDDRTGCNIQESVGYGDSIASILEKIDPDYWEWVGDLGEHPSQQVVFTLMAFRLAWEWLEAHSGKDRENGYLHPHELEGK